MSIIRNFLSRVFSSGTAQDPPLPPSLLTQPGQSQAIVTPDTLDAAVSKYPPYDTGIPATPFEQIIAGQQEIVNRIYRTAGVSRNDFAAQYEPLIRNLARFIHLLPATSTTFFSGTGGLFKFAIKLGLHSLNGASGFNFESGGSVERRHHMQPKWTLATFIAGICCQNYRALNNMVVLDKTHQQWSPMMSTLDEWLRQTQTSTYFVRWVEEADIHGAQASNAYLINQIVPPEILKYLAEDNSQVIQVMTAAITGVEANPSENPISRIVAPLITRIIEEERIESARNYGNLVIGAHLERHLIDAMRQLVKNGRWVYNNERAGSRVWIGEEGVFIDWMTGAQEMVGLLMKDGFAGIPKDPDTLADLLIQAGAFQAAKGGLRYWSIMLPDTGERKESMVKMASRQTLLTEGFDFTPYQGVRLSMAPAPKPAAAAAPAAPEPQVENLLQQQKKPKGPRQNPAPGSSPDPAMVAQEQGDAPPLGEPQKAQAPHVQGKPQPHKGESSQEKRQQQPKPERETKPGGAANSHEGQQSRTLGLLKKENAWLLREVIRNHREKKSVGVVAILPNGVGISHEELSSHGQPVMDLIEELDGKRWLWKDAIKQQRKIHQVDIGGVQHRMLIILPEAAADMGFEMGA